MTQLISPRLGAPMIDCRCHHQECREHYRLVGYCRNCQAKPIVGMFSLGHPKPPEWAGPACPKCGCRKLVWQGLEDDVKPPSDYSEIMPPDEARKRLSKIREQIINDTQPPPEPTC